ncbi:MAG: hypothetical protein QOF09_3984 [Alphaproteobacteria bacterium]|jgi:hypothetical protein|nr:hypothetical protein [Alphaproteobacteria bacterium]
MRKPPKSRRMALALIFRCGELRHSEARSGGLHAGSAGAVPVLIADWASVGRRVTLHSIVTPLALIVAAQLSTSVAINVFR